MCVIRAVSPERPHLKDLRESAHARSTFIRKWVNDGENESAAMNDSIQWLRQLGTSASIVDGLVLTEGYNPKGRPPEEVAIMEKAIFYDAHSVFFSAEQGGRPPVAQAFVYVTDDPAQSPNFASLHRRLWSWGGVPLIYRKSRGIVQLFRCAHGPDFVDKKGELVCNPVKTLDLASAIANDPWWNPIRLRNGTLWEDPRAQKELLKGDKSAHRRLFNAVKALDNDLNDEGVLLKRVRRRLLILALLIAYLEERDVLRESYFSRFKKGARKFFEVLEDGEALVNLLDALKEHFNGNVFNLEDSDRERLRSSNQLGKFAMLIQGSTERSGQLNLWKLYSFRDLPVELISHLYQIFVHDAAKSSIYTPPFLVRLMLEESLGWERLDRLEEQNEIILDPSCGSGVFLVEAYKRLILHWRLRHDWRHPTASDLRNLLDRVHGIDIEEGAIELAAFSLCLALCDALDPETIRRSTKLFPEIAHRTLRNSCFFAAKENNVISGKVGAVIGNPPFHSHLTTEGATNAYVRYKKEHGPLPDLQLAYLFLHEAAEILVQGGILCMLQEYNFLYNQRSEEFRRHFFERWDVREVLDFISIRGLFQKGKADTKVVVIVAVAGAPPAERQVLHATFRRSARADSEQGFDIDFYDLHWMPRGLMLTNDAVWRSNLLGGGRVLGFVTRLKKLRTLGAFAAEREWDAGEGFIEGKSGDIKPAEHLTGERLLPSNGISPHGILRDRLTTVSRKKFKSAYTRSRYTPPMVLIHEHMDLNHDLWNDGYLTYKNQIVGIPAPPDDLPELERLSHRLSQEKVYLRAYVAATSYKAFTQHATTLSGVDILSLPYPSECLSLSENEKIIAEDIVDHMCSLVRLGEKSLAMEPLSPVAATRALSIFSDVFVRQVGTVYANIRALDPQVWSGIVCQPFVFGAGRVNWGGAGGLSERLDALLSDQEGSSLRVTRIARIYDGPFLFFLKPSRLRYWLRSVALRDADETLAELRDQGY